MSESVFNLSLEYVSIFYFLLLFQCLFSMEKEKQNAPDYLETPRGPSVEELMQEAINNYEKAEAIFNEAVCIEPTAFKGSKYQSAEYFYYNANNFYTAAAQKGYSGASTLAKHVQERIHEIERKKLQLSPEFYSLSQGFVKSLRRTERAFTLSGDAKELITWQQMLRETSLINIKQDITNKEQEKINKLKQKEEEMKIKYEKKKRKKVNFNK